MYVKASRVLFGDSSFIVVDCTFHVTYILIHLSKSIFRSCVSLFRRGSVRTKRLMSVIRVLEIPIIIPYPTHINLHYQLFPTEQKKYSFWITQFGKLLH